MSDIESALIVLGGTVSCCCMSAAVCRGCMVRLRHKMLASSPHFKDEMKSIHARYQVGFVSSLCIGVISALGVAYIIMMVFLEGNT